MSDEAGPLRGISDPMTRYIKPVAPRGAHGLLGGLYDQIKEEFGVLGEPLTLHSPIPDLLAGVWAAFREALLAGSVRRELKEALAVAVSRLNGCPYCIEAHTVMLHARSRADAATALREARDDQIRDSEMRALLEWANATATPGAGILRSPPFRRAHAPEIIGTAVWVHYINRMVTLFLDRNLFLVSGGLKTLAEKLAGMLFSRTVRRIMVPGRSLDFLPVSSLSRELEWAADSAVIARAFGAMEAACEKAGRLALPDETREAVLRRLGTWRGNDPGLGRACLRELLGELREEQHSAAALALLTAIAPHEVGEETIRRFCTDRPGDHMLLAGTAWASFAAARRIGSWLALPDS